MEHPEYETTANVFFYGFPAEKNQSLQIQIEIV